MRAWWVVSSLFFVCFLQIRTTQADAAKLRQTEKQALGKAIFMDTALSEPAGQSCASCHSRDKAFADPSKTVSAGANPTRLGNRNAPSISYVRFTPEPHYNQKDETWVGGLFLDGRARTMHEQATGPLLNLLEMGNPNAAAVIAKLKTRPYAQQFTAIYGSDIWTSTPKAFDAVADALVAYEIGAEFAPFSSKYDAYLRGQVLLNAQEKHGLELFEDEKKGNCAACHPSQRGAKREMPLFTDFSYDNIGVPRNAKLPFYAMDKKFNPAGKNYVDTGLANAPYADAQKERGKFKVPTLRNVAKTAPYMHNGVFETLRDAVEFYNTRDTDKKWGAPEVPDNVNKDELGNLKLTEADTNALVAFLNTLSDGYPLPQTPKNRSALSH